jgi:putative membrane protein
MTMWGYGPGSGYGMMGGWGYGGYGGYGFGLIHIVFWAVVLIAIITGIVWLVRSTASAGTHGAAAARRSAGLDVLEERYARGDINRDEYLQKKRDILA